MDLLFGVERGSDGHGLERSHGVFANDIFLVAKGILQGVHNNLRGARSARAVLKKIGGGGALFGVGGLAHNLIDKSKIALDERNKSLLKLAALGVGHERVTVGEVFIRIVSANAGGDRIEEGMVIGAQFHGQSDVGGRGGVKLEMRSIPFLHADIKDHVPLVAAGGFYTRSKDAGNFVDALFYVFARRQRIARIGGDGQLDLLEGDPTRAVDLDGSDMRSYIVGLCQSTEAESEDAAISHYFSMI